MFAMTEERLDRLMRYERTLWVCGLGGYLVSWLTGGFPILSAFMAFWFGVTLSTLSEWRRDRGLWMLSALFAVISVTLYACFAYFELIDRFRQRQTDLATSVDCAVMTAILWQQCRFLIGITRCNRRMSNHRA